MNSRYFFLAAGIIFAGIAVVELLRLHNHIAAAVNAFAAVIFLYLGAVPAKRR